MSERHLGRGNLLVYRFALPQAVGLCAQRAGSQNDDEARFCD